MAKQAGLAWTAVTVDDSAGSARVMVNDVTTLDFATPRGVQDVTGLDKSAMERLLLLADFSVTFSGVFNDDNSSADAHAVFKTVPSTSVARTTTLVISGQTLTNEVFYTDFAYTRASDGSFTWTAPGVLAGGVVPTWS